MDYYDLSFIYHCYMQICGMPDNSETVNRQRSNQWFDTARQVCRALGKNASQEQVRKYLGIKLPS